MLSLKMCIFILFFTYIWQLEATTSPTIVCILPAPITNGSSCITTTQCTLTNGVSITYSNGTKQCQICPTNQRSTFGVCQCKSTFRRYLLGDYCVPILGTRNGTNKTCNKPAVQIIGPFNSTCSCLQSGYVYKDPFYIRESIGCILNLCPNTATYILGYCVCNDPQLVYFQGKCQLCPVLMEMVDMVDYKTCMCKQNSTIPISSTIDNHCILCHINSTLTSNQKKCICNTGHVGDGRNCAPLNT